MFFVDLGFKQIRKYVFTNLGKIKDNMNNQDYGQSLMFLIRNKFHCIQYDLYPNHWDTVKYFFPFKS